MFNPFQIYDEMLGMFTKDDEETIDTVWITKEIPDELEDEFHTMVDNWLTNKGYDPRAFDFEEEE